MTMLEYCRGCPVAKLVAGYQLLFEAGLVKFPSAFFAMMINESSPSGSQDLTLVPPCANNEIGYAGHRIVVHSFDLLMASTMDQEFTTRDLAQAQVRFVPDDSSGCSHCNGGLLAYSAKRIRELATYFPDEYIGYWWERWSADSSSIYRLSNDVSTLNIILYGI